MEAVALRTTRCVLAVQGLEEEDRSEPTWIDEVGDVLPGRAPGRTAASSRTPDLVVAFVVGAAVALAGVVVGRRWGSAR